MRFTLQPARVAQKQSANSGNYLDTEIDWVAYMEQVAQFVAGERDYTMIEGGTGPLVYPAAHVYMYTGLYYITDHGKNIMLAQQLFAGLYMMTLALVMLCYWKAKVNSIQTAACSHANTAILTCCNRFLRTFSLSSSSRNDSTASSSSGASTTASPSSSSGWPSSSSSGGCGRSARWRTRGA